jgi:hypothetical protein
MTVRSQNLKKIYAKPRQLKNKSSLPCKYVNNNKDWVTIKILIDFLKGLNAKLGSAGMKVTL